MSRAKPGARRAVDAKAKPKGETRGKPERAARQHDARGKPERAARPHETRGKPERSTRLHETRGKPERAARPHDTRGKPEQPRRDAAARGDGARRIAEGMGAHGAEAARAKKIARGAPRRGDWLFTTREFSENDLVEELERALGPGSAKVVSASLVRATGAPTNPDGALDVTFARQGFEVVHEARGEPGALAASIAPAMERALAATEGPWALHTWVPDSAASNPRDALAEALGDAIVERLGEGVRARRVPDAVLRRGGGVLVQLALTAVDRAAFGLAQSSDVLSFAPGGRARMKLGHDRPSRAARKVEEALAWLGATPGAGELCVDLGAAPGGWTWVLLEKRARVIAVDPAELREDLRIRRGLVHVKGSAFDYAPDEPVDWLFCDMAWRPLEAAALLAKWARRRWARLLVANLKLPMKKKAEMVETLRGILTDGGWKGVRTRQLYHDRDEITVTAHA